jgi:hypothetical protein
MRGLVRSLKNCHDLVRSSRAGRSVFGIVGAGFLYFIGLYVVGDGLILDTSLDAVTHMLATLLISAEEFSFEEANFFMMSLLNPDQGLAATSSLAESGLLNPGSDVDMSTSTDFEDLAGPVADVAEFSDQDRALLGDSVFANYNRLVLTAGACFGLAAGLAVVCLCTEIIRNL